MLETIFMWGWVAFSLLGVLLAIAGLISGDIPIVGFSKFSDSVVGRVAIGVGIGSIWPVFLLFFVVSEVCEKIWPQKKKRWGL